METEVGNFKGLELITNGTQWDLKTALKFFYLYIIPIGNKSTGDAGDIRSRLVTWISKGKRGRWDNHPNFNFDLDSFNQINKQAVDILLDTSLIDLNQNRFFEADGAKEKWFTEPSITTTNAEGKKETTKFSFGQWNLGENVKGLNVKDNKKYQEYRNLIIASKNELEALKVEQNMAMGDSTQNAFSRKVNVTTKSIAELSEKLEDLKKPMYNDDITLRQVVANESIVKQFYSIGGNVSTVIGEDNEAKLALAVLRETVSRNLSESEYDELYGGDDLSYDEFKKFITEKEEEYFKLLKIPFQIQTKLVGISKDNEVINITVAREKLIQEKHPENLKLKGKLVAGKTLSDLADVTHFPIKMTNQPDIESKEDLLNFIRTRGDIKQIDRLLYRVLNKYKKDVLEPLFKIRADITIETKGVEERGAGDLRQLPVRMSADTIEEFILNKVTDIKNISYPKFKKSRAQAVKRDKNKKIILDKDGKSIKLFDKDKNPVWDYTVNMDMFFDTTKNKFKMPIDFKDIKMDFESAYAKTVNAGSRNAISGEKQHGRKINKKGTVVINSDPISIPVSLFKQLPGLGAEEEWKHIRKTLTNYYSSSGTTSVEQRLAGKIKKTINPNMIDKLTDAISLVEEINEIQSDSDIPDVINTEDFKTSYWLEKNGEFKYTLDDFKIKLAKDSDTKGKNMERSLNKLSIILGKIIEYVEIHGEAIDETYEEFDKEESDKEFNERRAREREQREEETKREGEAANRRDIAEREEDEDTNRQALERGLDPDQENVEDFVIDLETGDDKITERNVKLLELLKELKDDDLEEVDKIKEDLDKLRSDIKKIKKTKGINIKTGDFRKALNGWSETHDYDVEPLLKLIKNIKDGVKSEEQNKIKGLIKKERLNMEEYWNEMKESKEFQVPEAGTFVRLIKEVNLGKVLAKELAENKLFNNGRNGLVTASANKLRIEVDYKARKLYVKGQIKWVSARESHLGFKIEHTNIIPRERLHSTLDQTQKDNVGKKISGKGRIQDDKQVGETQNKQRYDFYREVQNKMKVLQGAI